MWRGERTLSDSMTAGAQNYSSSCSRDNRNSVFFSHVLVAFTPACVQQSVGCLIHIYMHLLIIIIIIIIIPVIQIQIIIVIMLGVGCFLKKKKPSACKGHRITQGKRLMYTRIFSVAAPAVARGTGTT